MESSPSRGRLKGPLSGGFFGGTARTSRWLQLTELMARGAVGRRKRLLGIDEAAEGSGRACPIPACQLRNRDLTVVTCSVSTIVRRSERGIQSGCDDGLHDGRTGGEHDAPAAWRSHFPQSVPLPAGVLWTSLIKKQWQAEVDGRTAVLAERET
ncbi:hypothetical protein KM043_009899 [Ampulex compressa]|nr:hypothetical protein KM043_009899 [Ampulex compressa]